MSLQVSLSQINADFYSVLKQTKGNADSSKRYFEDRIQRIKSNDIGNGTRVNSKYPVKCHHVLGIILGIGLVLAAAAIGTAILFGAIPLDTNAAIATLAVGIGVGLLLISIPSYYLHTSTTAPRKKENKIRNEQLSVQNRQIKGIQAGEKQYKAELQLLENSLNSLKVPNLLSFGLDKTQFKELSDNLKNMTFTRIQRSMGSENILVAKNHQGLISCSEIHSYQEYLRIQWYLEGLGYAENVKASIYISGF